MTTLAPEPAPAEGMSWDSSRTLLLLAITQMIDKNEDNDFDWELVSRKLNHSGNGKWTVSAQDCESRYRELLDLGQKAWPRVKSLTSKRAFLTTMVAEGMYMASQSRVAALRTKLQSLGEEVIAEMSKSEEDGAKEEENEASETETTDSDEDLDDESCRDLYKMFAVCFKVENKALENLPSDKSVEFFLKQLRISKKLRGPEVGNGVKEVPSTSGEGILKETRPEEEDGAKDSGLGSSPTLSRLLELPPKEKSVPLPQINTLLDTRESEEPMETSPTRQDSPTKLLAALGTTTTPVRGVPVPASKTSLPGFVLTMTESPMKPIEETELTSYKDSVQQQESPEKASLGTSVVENNRIAVANKTEGLSTREEQKPVNETVSSTSPSTSVAVILDLEVSEKSEKKSSSDGQQQSLLKSSVEKSMEPEVKIENVETTRDSSSSPTRVLPVDISIVKIEDTELKDASPEKRGKGKQETTDPITPHSTRNSIKEKSTPEMSLTSKETTPTRRGKHDSASEDTRTEDSAPASGMKNPQRRLFAPKSNTEVHTPNLRSRRIPTPTPPQDEDSRGKRSKTGEKEEKAGKEDDGNTSIIESKKAFKNDAGSEREDDERGKETEEHKKKYIPSSKVDPGDLAEDENSNSGTDSAKNKRLTRRSVKIVTTSDPASKDGEPQKDEDGVHKETKTRQSRKSLSRLKLTRDESVEKDDQAEGKRVTRARARTSTSPARTRTKSTGSVKSVAKSDVDTETESETGPSRTTRSRVGGTSTSETPVALPDSGPNSPSSVSTSIKEEDEKDLKALRKQMLQFLSKVEQHQNANIYSSLANLSEERRKKMKRPMDFSTIRKNIEAGSIKTLLQLERDLNIIFLNFLMFTPASDTSGQLMNAAVATFCQKVFEETRSIIKPPPIGQESLKKEESDEEPATVEDNIPKTPTTSKPGGRKRRNRSISTSEDQPETKRRTLRTSTTAATTATSALQSSRKKIHNASPDISSFGRGRQD